MTKDWIIIARFLDGTEQVEERITAFHKDARSVMLDIWKHKYNAGKDEKDPRMGHSSGVLCLQMVEDIST